MLTCMVIYGQFNKLFQHLTLSGGPYRRLHILTFFGIGQESRKLIKDR